jgi:pentatricopeptide repeat protein
MKNAGCHPNHYTFNAIIVMYRKKGNFKKMMLVFDEMNSSGYTPDRFTWNTIVVVFGTNGMHMHVAKVFKEMKKDEFILHQ